LISASLASTDSAEDVVPTLDAPSASHAALDIDTVSAVAAVWVSVAVPEAGAKARVLLLPEAILAA
jgi:hypothetical protein